MYNGNLFPRVGKPFATQRRRPILLFQENRTPGKHDMLVAACNPSRYALLGVTVEHASREDNLLRCMQARGHDVEVPQPINLFTNIPQFCRSVSHGRRSNPIAQRGPTRE